MEQIRSKDRCNSEQRLGSYSGRINTKLLKGKDFYHCYWHFFNVQIFVIYISKKFYIIGYIFIQISTNTVFSTQQACGRLAASEMNRKAVNTACSLGSLHTPKAKEHELLPMYLRGKHNHTMKAQALLEVVYQQLYEHIWIKMYTLYCLCSMISHTAGMHAMNYATYSCQFWHITALTALSHHNTDHL